MLTKGRQQQQHVQMYAMLLALLVLGSQGVELFRALPHQFFQELWSVQIDDLSIEVQGDRMNCSWDGSGEEFENGLSYVCRSEEIVVKQGETVGFLFQMNVPSEEYEFEIEVKQGVFNGLYVRSQIEAFPEPGEFEGVPKDDNKYVLILKGLHGNYEVASEALADESTIVFVLRLYDTERVSNTLNTKIVSDVQSGCCRSYRNCVNNANTDMHQDSCTRSSPNTAIYCTRDGKLLHLTLDISNINKFCNIGDYLKNLPEMKSLTLNGYVQSQQNIWTRLFGARGDKQSFNPLLMQLRSLRVTQDQPVMSEPWDELDLRLSMVNLERLVIEHIRIAVSLPPNWLKNMVKLQVLVLKDTKLNMDPFSALLENEYLWYVDLSGTTYIPMHQLYNVSQSYPQSQNDSYPQLNSSSELDLDLNPYPQQEPTLFSLNQYSQNILHMQRHRQLHNLKWLSLSHINLNNSELFYKELCIFPNLLYLDVSSNSMKGNISNFLQYQHVQRLYLQDNLLSGVLPKEISVSFRQLENLRIDRNLLNGTLDLGCFPDSLQSLNVSFNAFRKLSHNNHNNIDNFDINYSDIYNDSAFETIGTIDSGSDSSNALNFKKGAKSLRTIDISHNQLGGGSFHSGLFSQQLTSLNLSYNKIIDPVSGFFEPLSLENFNNSLVDLRINDNKLIGTLPGLQISKLRGFQLGTGTLLIQNNHIQEISNFSTLLYSITSKNEIVEIDVSGNNVKCPKMTADYLSYGINQIKCIAPDGKESSLFQVFANQYGRQLICEEIPMDRMKKEIVLKGQKSCGGWQQGSGQTDYYFIEVEQDYLKEFYEIVLSQNNTLQVAMKISYLGPKNDQSIHLGNFSKLYHPSQETVIRERINEFMQDRPGWWVITIFPLHSASVQLYKLKIQLESNPRVNRVDQDDFVTMDPPGALLKGQQGAFELGVDRKAEAQGQGLGYEPKEEQQAKQRGEEKKKGGVLKWGVASVVLIVCIPFVLVLLSWHFLHLYLVWRRRQSEEQNSTAANLQMELVFMMNRVFGQRIIEQLPVHTREEFDQENNWTQTDCAICLEELQSRQQLTQLPCGHRFHAQCIHNWIYRRGLNADCPICKGIIYETLSVRESNNNLEQQQSREEEDEDADEEEEEDDEESESEAETLCVLEDEQRSNRIINNSFREEQLPPPPGV